MARSLTQVYREFVDDTSPVNSRTAAALGASDAAVRALEPADARKPAVVLAALHDLVLAGRAPELAVDWDPDVAVETLLAHPDEVLAPRTVRTDSSGYCPVLHPAIALAAHQVGASAVGLLDVDCRAGFSLLVDRVGIDLDNGQTLGDPASPVRLSAGVAGRQRVPAFAIPEVVSRTGLDRDPVDVTDPDQARWLRACVPPDAAEQAARLRMEIALTDVELLRGETLDLLPEAIARVPAHALPVVTTTWALSRLPLDDRLRFLHRLDAAATHRPVAWVSVEGVGVAPAIPTMGDRRASGHSTIGLAVFEHASLHAESVGRCWSRGRTFSYR